MKNISELNARWYWRMIKVIYTILFLLILIGGIVVIKDIQWQHKIDINNTRLICYSPNDRLFLFPEKHETFSLKDIGINNLESSYDLRTNGFNYENFITNNPYNALQMTIFCMNENNKNEKDYNKEDIKKYNISGIDMFMWQKSYELRFGVNKIISNKGRVYTDLTKEEEENFANQMKEYEDYVNNSYNDYDRASKLDFSVKMFDLKIKYLYSEFIIYLLGFFALIYTSFELIKRIFYYIIIGKFFPKENE